MKASDNIIAATLMVVAAIANRMMNREKDCCRLSAILLAMKRGVFNRLVSMKVQMYWAFFKTIYRKGTKFAKNLKALGFYLALYIFNDAACVDCF